MEKPEEYTIDREYILNKFSEERIRQVGELYPNSQPETVSAYDYFDPGRLDFNCDSREEFHEDMKAFFNERIDQMITTLVKRHGGLVPENPEPMRIELDWDGNDEFDLGVTVQTIECDRTLEAGIKMLMEEEKKAYDNRWSKYNAFVQREEKEQRAIERERRELRSLIRKHPELASKIAEEFNNGVD